MFSKLFTMLNQRLETMITSKIWLPNWAKNTAIQQGVITLLTALISLFLMASISLAYVDYELNLQNEKILEGSKETYHGQVIKITDNPIEDDDIITALTTGFIFSGLLVAGLSSIVIVSMTRANKRRIDRLEWVLSQAAEGKLSARTGEKNKINDLARIEVAVDEMLSRLESSVTSMNHISSNIAHELKTPITRLQHNLIDLKISADEIDTHKSVEFYKALEAAQMESLRLANIFDALLRISQIESGARRSRFHLLNLNDIFETISDIYVDVAEDTNMTLSIYPSDKVVMVQGDRELLIQQLANLIENAMKYCPANSQIKLSCEAKAGLAYIYLSDNGPGISDSEKKHVFERFYRIDRSRTDFGLGLGLSLVKAIVGLHYGKIALYDNHPGLGIKITLPLAKLTV